MEGVQCLLHSCLIRARDLGEKVILGIVSKSPVHKFEVGLSSSFTVEENYFSHLAKKTIQREGMQNPRRLELSLHFFLLEAG